MESALLAVQRLEVGGVRTIRCEGEVDLSTSGLLVDALSGEIAGRPRELVLDLTGVGFLDSSGLRAIGNARLDCAVEGIVLEVRASRVVRRVLDLTGMTDLLSPETRRSDHQA